MVLLNEFALSKVMNVGDVSIIDAKKNSYKNELGIVEHEVVIDGRITVPCSIDYSSNEELVEKLNNVQPYLRDGYLTLNGVAYEVELLSGIEPSTDFNNFNLVFSWNGSIVENHIKQHGRE